MTDSGGINNVLVSAVNLGKFLDATGWPYCFIGGVAYQRWGEPRQTLDVDGVLFTGFGDESNFAEALLDRYDSRIEDPVAFAVQNRIVLLEDESKVGIDLSLGALPFEERLIDRSSNWDVKNHGTIRTCSAADLVTLKSIASRPQDWIDIEKVIIRQGSKLDQKQIFEELRPLAELKEEPEIIENLKILFQKHAA